MRRQPNINVNTVARDNIKLTTSRYIIAHHDEQEQDTAVACEFGG